MLVTPEINRRNQTLAASVAVVGSLAVSLLLGFAWGLFPAAVVGVLLGSGTYWWLRRKCQRRLAAIQKPFSAVWEAILRSRVKYYQALTEDEKQRFRQLVQVFLNEIPITGIRTDIDETIRVLVAASAIIPIFGFHDWDYHRLSEVLIYPDRFNDKYRTDGDERNILGLTGYGHLSGTMILSKPALLEGFNQSQDRQNVGIHEFAHLIEQEEVSHGLPPEVDIEAVRSWVAFVGRELPNPGKNKAHINPYGYTNEHELFAVLAEYFFKSPEFLQNRDPALYQVLRKLFHQDPASLMGQLHMPVSTAQADCPCGSKKKFRDCCQPNRVASHV